MSDDAIVEFFVRPDVPLVQNEDEDDEYGKWNPYGELSLRDVCLTKDLFKRLVEVSARVDLFSEKNAKSVFWRIFCFSPS